MNQSHAKKTVVGYGVYLLLLAALLAVAASWYGVDVSAFGVMAAGWERFLMKTSLLAGSVGLLLSVGGCLLIHKEKTDLRSVFAFAGVGAVFLTAYIWLSSIFFAVPIPFGRGAIWALSVFLALANNLLLQAWLFWVIKSQLMTMLIACLLVGLGFFLFLGLNPLTAYFPPAQMLLALQGLEPSRGHFLAVNVSYVCLWAFLLETVKKGRTGKAV